MFLEPGNGGFKDGQFYAGLNFIDPKGDMEFEELLIALSQRLKAPASAGPSYITDRVLRMGCARLLWCFQNSVWRASSCYQNFAARLGSTPGDAVVCFNWDLLVEKMLADAAVPWSYCVSDPGVPVLKPHGSINWSGHLRERLRAEYDGWRPLGPGSQLCFDAREPLSNPNKQEINSSLRYMIFPGDPDLPGEDADVAWLWDQIRSAISGRDSLVFIGYSLPEYDSFASEFFRSAAKGKEVEAYTPSADHLSRYRALFGAAAVLWQETFEQCKYAAAFHP
jgi:hypothetical protein